MRSRIGGAGLPALARRDRSAAEPAGPLILRRDAQAELLQLPDDRGLVHAEPPRHRVRRPALGEAALEQAPLDVREQLGLPLRAPEEGGGITVALDRAAAPLDLDVQVLHLDPLP